LRSPSESAQSLQIVWLGETLSPHVKNRYLVAETAVMTISKLRTAVRLPFPAFGAVFDLPLVSFELFGTEFLANGVYPKLDPAHSRSVQPLI